MALEKLNVKDVEKKWSDKWDEWNVHAYHDSPADKRPVWSVDTPPPFTSGALHMGHVLSYSYFDFAARYKRMTGHNVFFPQGWDCQGFPTEVKVEAKYGKNLSRKEFLEKCHAFTLENIVKMKSQMRRIAHSPDWTYEYKTIDPAYTRKVQLSLLDSFEKGLVYRARHPILFCWNCHSAIAKAETEDLERTGSLNFLTFPFADEKSNPKGAANVQGVKIATSRPEYLHACVAVLVHPDDARYKAAIGKKVTVPLYGQSVPVIAEKDVDPAFGTGALMLCTFGDKMDVVWQKRHELPVMEAIDSKGLLINSHGKFDGQHIVKAKDLVIT